LGGADGPGSFKRVAVLKGGASLERQVSLRSGARVAHALRARGYDVTEIDVGNDLVRQLEQLEPDVVFIAMHGRGGEDGTIQELLEILRLPYAGCGVLSSIRCMDKVLAKLMFQEAGIPTPDFAAFNETAFRQLGAGQALGAIEQQLGFPVVVKPARQGSALGIKFAASAAEVPAALVNAFSYDDRVLLERYVSGRELAISLLDGEPLPVVEAVPQEQAYFDFESRYEIGKTTYVCPAELADAVETRVNELACATFELLGCEGFARVDFILPEDDEPQVLEVNAIPGLTDTSLMPQAAEAAGIGFEELSERLLLTASARAGDAIS
jgi:D-alanine-D-alanine ligase